MFYSNYNYDGFTMLKDALSLDYILNPDPGESTFATRAFHMKKYLFNFDIPLLGYGSRTFRLLNAVQDSGSLYVNLWFSYGPLAFFIFLIFLIRNLRKNFLSTPKIFLNSFMWIIITISLIGGFSETTLLGTRGLYFFILLGVVLNRIEIYNKERKNV